MSINVQNGMLSQFGNFHVFLPLVKSAKGYSLTTIHHGDCLGEIDMITS